MQPARRERTAQKFALGLALVLLIALTSSASSSANGPCGQDFDGNTACPVNSPATYIGSLITDNEADYYVFRAHKGTELSYTITDTENPQCDDCGEVNIELLNAQGEDQDQGADSSPRNGITVPGKVSHTLESGGTYYFTVSGDLASDSNGNPLSVPYSLEVNASPNVVWPPPTPAPPPSTESIVTCKTKHVRRRRHHHWRRVRVRVCHVTNVPG